MTTLRTKLGARIREIRKSMNLSQDKFADIIDWDKANISNLENGKSFLKPESMEKISRALNIEVQELFNFEHQKTEAELKIEILNMLKLFSYKEIQFLYKMMKSLGELR